MKNVGTFWIILMVLNVTVPASGLDLQIQPVMGIPFGDDALQFATGAGGDAQLMFALPFAPVLSFGPSAGFYHLPVHDQYTTVSLFNGGAGGLLSIPLTTWFNLDFSVGGGYYYALLNDPSIGGGSGWFSAKAGFSFNLFDTIGLGVTGGYRSFLGMYQDAFASAAISLKLGTSGRAGVAKGKAPEPAVAVSQTAPAPVQASASASANGKIAISQVELGTVFPVFYAWYDNHPLGTVTITNSGTEAVENLKVSFFVESFMDNPKNSPSPTSLQPGESAEVPVFALFNNKMMEVSEGTKASYRVIIDYTVADQKKNEERVDTLSLYDRNSLAWDDDRKAAVFVTAKDQSVLSFAKNTAAMAPENEAVDGNLRTAMAVHEALRLYGMSYIVDPASSYTDLSKKESAVDYLQFPRQTLEYKSGDCDDLTILYCSLLESVNIETAFITIPGHIFMAFALETSPDESRKKYLKADDFIFLDGKTWVPLEITMTKEHFLRIWQEGTKEWLENSSREQAVLIPVRKAWGDYRPVGFPGSFSINLPAKAPVVEATAAEVTKFINREIASRVAQYQADINSSQGDPKTVNKLGVLYAKYGLYAEAAREFERAVAVREHAPSLLNLGNLAFHTGDFAKAYSWYSRVVALEPKNALAVLGMARVAHELENYGEVKNLYATLQTLNPDYARQFAYLDLRGAEATRAADMGQVKDLLIWGDE